MKSPAQQFLSEAEQRRVTDAVKAAERKTSGEIVPMIVSASHDYPRARLVCALGISLLFTFPLSWMLSPLFDVSPENLYFFLSILLPLFFISHRLSGRYPRLYRFFLAAEEVEEEVEEEAIKNFFLERLYETAGKNGILLFISVFEKKVWILADKGIQEKLDNSTWEAIVSELSLRIGKGDRCDSICRAIEQIGNILESHFPYRKDDEDELHNLIIR